MNTFSSTTSSESPSPPLETQHVVTSLPSSPVATPITIATTASASASVTTLEDSSPRHFQHPSPRAQQQPLVPQVTKVCRKRQWKILATRTNPAKLIIFFVFLSCSKSRQSQFRCLLSWIQERTPFQLNHNSLQINRVLLPVFNRRVFHHRLWVGQISTKLVLHRHWDQHCLPRCRKISL